MANERYKLPKEETVVFTSQLALILDSDVSLYEGLELIKNRTDNLKFQGIIEGILAELSKGKSLSDAINVYEDSFSLIVTKMISLGEKTGDLPKVLNQVTYTLEKEIEIENKVKSAVAYPIILSVLMLGVILLLVIKVLPMFNDILESLGGEMPGLTKGIMSISFFIGSYYWVIILLIIVWVIASFFYKNTEKGQLFFDRVRFKIPIINAINQSLNAVSFARNLSIIIKSGISINIGLRMIQETITNKFIKAQLDEAIKEIEEGKPIDQGIEKLDLFPAVLIKLFSVAQNTGHMDEMLDKAALVMERETDAKLNRLTTVIEPILIIFLSVIVGIILISVILPIINIMNSIG